MQNQSAARSKILELHSSRSPRRHTLDAAGTVETLVSRLESLEERNHELVENNAQLVAALERINSTLLRFEQSVSMNRELAASALQATAQAAGHSSLLALSQKAPASDNPVNGRRVSDGNRTDESETVDLALSNLATAANDRLVSHLRRLTEQLSRFATVSAAATEAHTDHSSVEPKDRRTHLPLVERSVSEDDGRRGSTVEVLAGPLSTFAEVTAFHRSLKRVPGVGTVMVKSFDRGKLLLTMDCTSTPTSAQILETARPELRGSGSTSAEDIDVLVLGR